MWFVKKQLLVNKPVVIQTQDYKIECYNALWKKSSNIIQNECNQEKQRSRTYNAYAFLNVAKMWTTVENGWGNPKNWNEISVTPSS